MVAGSRAQRKPPDQIPKSLITISSGGAFRCDAAKNEETGNGRFSTRLAAKRRVRYQAFAERLWKYGNIIV